MTFFLAPRRDLACRTGSDDEVLIGPDLVLPELPEPGPFGRMILAVFAEPSEMLEFDFEHEVEIILPPGLRLH